MTKVSTAPTTRKPCRCGCGALAKTGRNYVLGHKPTTLLGRMMAKIVVTPSGCWEWHGARHPLGYGNVRVGKGNTSAHRAMYELHRGAIPTGADLDHLCRNPPCCNPDHLEPVTHRVNVLRGAAPMVAVHNSGRCRRGHDTDEHAYRRKSTGAVVYCRVCRRERERKTR